MDTSLFEGTLVESERILYTPSTFARTNLIHLQECGRLKALSPHTSHRENLASYLCFIVLEGSGTLEYDQKHYTLSAGDCVFLDCKKSYLHRCSNQLWTLEWAHFYGPNMPGIYEKYTERGGLACFRPQSLAPYQKILDSLCETASSSDYVRDMKIFEQLTALLSLLMQDSWHPGSTAKPTSRKYNLQQIKDYLDFHYPETIRLDDLAETFYINKFYLTRIFRELFGGGHARLYLSDEANVLESGIEIEVSPPGKVIKNLSALSGGEQALVAISIYFAILNVNPAPFCFLDEIEAALDDVNVARYAQYLRRMTDHTQFIVITHRRGTMEAADVLYGVTMQEDGVSKILRLDLDNVSADLIT